MTLHHKKKLAYNNKKPTAKKTLVFAVIVSLFGGASANAFLDPNFNGPLSSVITGINRENIDSILSMLYVSNTQVAITPDEVGKAMHESARLAAGSFITVNASNRARQAIDDYTLGQEEDSIDPKTGKLAQPIAGSGLSSGLSCKASTDKSIIQSKDLIKQSENYSASQRLAQMYSYDSTTRYNNRVSKHLDNYCDITETASKLCPLVTNGMESADTNYASLYNTDALSEDGVNAAISYTLNVSDPISIQVAGCNSAVCNQSSSTNTAYKALSNVAQGAFVNQINSRVYYEYQGSKAGKALGKSTNIKLSADNPVGAAPVAEAPAPSSDPTGIVYFGDSIAHGYKAANSKGVIDDSTTHVGDNPKQIYNRIKTYLASNPDALKGKAVVLSSGKSNATSGQDNFIIEQIRTLQGAGATVYLLGIANNYAKADPKKMTADLVAIAKKTGVEYLGNFHGDDGIHPAKNYSKPFFIDKIKIAPPTAPVKTDTATTKNPAKTTDTVPNN